jgi:hypothetical protein
MRWTDAKELIRGQIEHEFASGYPILRRIPDEYTWRHLAAVDLLKSAERSSLFDLLAERGCLRLETDIEPAEWQQRYYDLRKNAVLERFHNSIATQAPWKYADPSYMRKCLDSWRRYNEPVPVKHHLRSGRGAPARSPGGPFGAVLLAVAEAAEPPKKCAAAKIRAAVVRSFADRFGVKRVKAEYGAWKYKGEFNNRPFTLKLSWTWIGGPQYGVAIGTHECGLNPPAWEGLLGFGTGSWDFLCEHNLTNSINLLGEIIEKAVTLLPMTRRLP